MGSSESKVAVLSGTKTETGQRVRNEPINRLMDPRSPSSGIDRTPIQVGGPVSKTSVNMKSECALPSGDPRSPTVGIARTPIRDAMRVTVDSLARRLSVFFHGEIPDEAALPTHRTPKRFNLNVEEVIFEEELDSTEPLLTPQPSQTPVSLAEQNNLVNTVSSSLQGLGDSSPFVLLEEAQIEVGAEVDLVLDEAEEATESPLHKRFSMSLITCHEGTAPSQIFAEVHNDSHLSLVPTADGKSFGEGTDRSCGLPSVTSAPECPTPVQISVPDITDVVVPVSSEQPEETFQSSPSAQEPAEVQDSPGSPTLSTSEPPTVPSPVLSPEPPQPCTGIRCPTLETKSPSQVVFKPQWLGKGFGTTGLRARGVQARGGKGGSSPLAVRVAVKNIANENKGQSGKMKQKGNGLAEGRSPLQILKKTNSPREKPSQMKLKSSTQDGQRLEQMERRVLTVAMDKENR
ncbi:cell division cycle-associated protein 3 [Lampris incognitus]|uniref:cell division cycle-associated protein 3 n=1 Tax=Lampris incognitus TaxID=2546036 RepID=UPI0024B520AF|nr:cell division cycle-associated protein 3 [Lampris incognitus]